MKDERNTRGETFDRYNYVEHDNEHDVYSSSNGRTRGAGDGGRRGGRKGSCAGKFFGGFFIAVLVLALIGGGIFLVMSSRANYEKVDTEQYETLPEEAPDVDVADENGIFNVLLIGADMNPDGSNGRSDTMMLVSIDSKNKVLRLVSFLRDIYLDIPTVGGERLNAAYAYGGAALTMQTIENYFRINIDKYIQTNFANFEEIINTMDGIDLEIADYEAEFINSSGEYSVESGMNHLNGAEALYFARIRKLDSDFNRTGRQRQVVLAMLDKFKKQNIAQMTSMMYSYLPYVTHNLSQTELLYLVSIGASLSDYETETMYVPAMDTFSDAYATIDGVEGNWVLDVDFEANASLLREFIYGD